MVINKKLSEDIIHWIPIAIVTTILSGLIYLAVQHEYRMTANDPQIQMAEDTASALAKGRSPQSFLTQDMVDMTQSLSPYLMLFNMSGKPILSTVQLDGKIPTLPSGVFTDVKNSGEKRFTWQQESGVRSAVVITSYHGVGSGFALAGRSLREVEKREDQLVWEVFIAWIVGLLVSLGAAIVLHRKKSV